MDTDIHKGTKVGDVGDRALEDHSRLQVVHGLNAIGKGGRFELRARVAAGFFQLFDDVGYRRHAKALVGKVRRFQTA